MPASSSPDDDDDKDEGLGFSVADDEKDMTGDSVRSEHDDESSETPKTHSERSILSISPN